MRQVLTKALQLHPAASGLWSYAAAWEFEHNSNAAAARTLMQRGLRMCKTSQQLWLEYFRMELLYAHKLRTRRRILGIDDAAGIATSFQVTFCCLHTALQGLAPLVCQHMQLGKQLWHLLSSCWWTPYLVEQHYLA